MHADVTGCVSSTPSPATDRSPRRPRNCTTPSRRSATTSRGSRPRPARSCCNGSAAVSGSPRPGSCWPTGPPRSSGGSMPPAPNCPPTWADRRPRAPGRLRLSNWLARARGGGGTGGPASGPRGQPDRHASARSDRPAPRREGRGRGHLPLRRDRARARRPPAPPARRSRLRPVTRQERSLAALRDATWIAGCERCRSHLLTVCADAGFDPRIEYSSDDMVVMQALVAAGLGVATQTGLALLAHRIGGSSRRNCPGRSATSTPRPTATRRPARHRRPPGRPCRGRPLGGHHLRASGPRECRYWERDRRRGSSAGGTVTQTSRRRASSTRRGGVPRSSSASAAIRGADDDAPGVRSGSGGRYAGGPPTRPQAVARRRIPSARRPRTRRGTGSAPRRCRRSPRRSGPCSWSPSDPANGRCHGAWSTGRPSRGSGHVAEGPGTSDENRGDPAEVARRGGGPRATRRRPKAPPPRPNAMRPSGDTWA